MRLEIYEYLASNNGEGKRKLSIRYYEYKAPFMGQATRIRKHLRWMKVSLSDIGQYMQNDANFWVHNRYKTIRFIVNITEHYLSNET